MQNDFLFDGRFDNALSYDEYLELWKKYIEETDISELDEKQSKNFEYSKLNLHRTFRIHKTYQPGATIVELIKNINSPQKWIVLTEHWCGDSGQNLPYIAELSKLNDLIDIRVIERDTNLDIMDRYLTNGKSRSIPKLVVFDEDGVELFRWGPRPLAAQKLFNELKEINASPDERNQKIHLWYGRNRGAEIEKEFEEIFEGIKDLV